MSYADAILTLTNPENYDRATQRLAAQTILINSDAPAEDVRLAIRYAD